MKRKQFLPHRKARFNYRGHHRGIITSETYTYILCYGNSRFSSDKAGDITTVCSCIQFFSYLETYQSSMTDITVSRAPFLCRDDSHGVEYEEHKVTSLLECDVMYPVKGLPGF